MHALDLSLFYLLHGISGHYGWLDFLIVFFGEYSLYVLLAILGYFLCVALLTGKMKRAYGYCVAALAGLVARFGVAEAIRFIYHRPRPFVGLHVSHLLTDTSHSFPSGHTIFLFALATVLLFVHRRLGYFFLGAGLVVGLARVAGGVHYPSDIAGGAVLGVITGLLVYALWRNLSRSINIPQI
jgi:undecaprenyl-diphosphatase